MKEIPLLAVCILLMSVGMLAPFVWGLAYVWVDTFVPHRISWSVLSQTPISMIMAVGTLGTYLLMDRRAPPRMTLLHAMILLMAGWITLTTTWALVPGMAWVKWDPSVKVLLFAFLIPFLFRSRVQIEAFVLVFAASAAGHLMPWGIKTAFSGGGYELALGLLTTNGGPLAESSTVAGITVMFIPLLLWFRTHSLIVANSRLRLLAVTGLIPLYLVATIGTFARTGLLTLGVLGIGMVLRTKRKVLFLALGAVCVLILTTVMSSQWTARISTVSDYQNESSAMIRILVWRWTLDFVQTHPLGGGFNVFVINKLSTVLEDGTVLEDTGRAFHSVFFAVLGEHGYPGFVLYVGIMLLSLLTMQRVVRRLRQVPEMQWASDLAKAAQLGLVLMLTAGLFVDLSFLYMIWDLVALSMCVNAHVARVLEPQRRPAYLEPVGGARPLAPGV